LPILDRPVAQEGGNLRKVNSAIAPISDNALPVCSLKLLHGEVVSSIGLLRLFIQLTKGSILSIEFTKGSLRFRSIMSHAMFAEAIPRDKRLATDTRGSMIAKTWPVTGFAAIGAVRGQIEYAEMRKIS
jgi:hypothetical protein